MNQKRGQITIFLVVGILLLFVSAGIYYAVSMVTKSDLAVQDQKAGFALSVKPRVNSFVQYCLEKTAEEGIPLISQQGGVNQFPKETLYTEELRVAYSYKEKQLVTKETVEKELAGYIDEEIYTCFESDAFQDEVLLLEYGKAFTTVGLSDDNVFLQLTLPVTATNTEGDSAQFDQFQSAIPSALGMLVDKLNSFIASQKNLAFWNPELYTQDTPYITIFPFDQDRTIISLYDETYSEPLIFFSALEFAPVNEPPKLVFMPDQVLLQGEKFSYQVEALDKDKMTFSTDNTAFPISQEGMFDFIPKQKGEFFITIIVEDTKGAKDEQKVRFVVE